MELLQSKKGDKRRELEDKTTHGHPPTHPPTHTHTHATTHPRTHTLGGEAVSVCVFSSKCSELSNGWSVPSKRLEIELPDQASRGTSCRGS